MGNLAQIDTPYLTEGSSGLTYAVDRFMGWPHGGHIKLQKGERSRRRTLPPGFVEGRHDGLVVRCQHCGEWRKVRPA